MARCSRVYVVSCRHNNEGQNSLELTSDYVELTAMLIDMECSILVAFCALVKTREEPRRCMSLPPCRADDCWTIEFPPGQVFDTTWTCRVSHDPCIDRGTGRAYPNGSTKLYASVCGLRKMPLKGRSPHLSTHADPSNCSSFLSSGPLLSIPRSAIRPFATLKLP